MTRLLFWLALAFLVVAAIRSKLRAAAREQHMRDDPRRHAERVAAERAAAAAAQAQAQARSPQAQARAAAVAEAETMLGCAHCGVFFPASEAVRRDGRDYCCEGHARAPAPPAAS
ncbi:PP0621 family protein [Pseudoduganella sp. LjRoot289]|uniref:PP0621 family protein n=1 Tax=Pseudoduganella sp. LjRoot289 TaxID=3342314 RepID=UPI003ECE6FAF